MSQPDHPVPSYGPFPYPPPPYRRPSLFSRVFWGILQLGLSTALSLALFVLCFFVLVRLLSTGGLDDSPLHERHYAGSRTSPDKVAVVRLDGLLAEGLTGYMRKQIDEAAKDSAVKAVVLRVNSPGGTITASDELYQRLRELRDGNPDKKTFPKPIIASMGSVAASGGYYVSMPATQIVAERTTITGSIGVYAAFPNITELADKYGVKMNVIKAGEVKDSGSMFHEMTPEEHQLWQDMVDHAFNQFLSVVQDGRGPRLKYPLREKIPEETREIAGKEEGGKAAAKKVTYTRRLADGGIFTADKAKKYGLIDQIGYLEDAIALARKTAGLDEEANVIMYERPQYLLGLLTGDSNGTGRVQSPLDMLTSASSPRIWYLLPQGGLAGFFGTTSTESAR